MSKLNKFFAQLVIFGLLTVQLANALQCYMCDSKTTKECNKGTPTNLQPEECQPEVIEEKVPEWLASIIHTEFLNTAPDVTVPMVCQKITATNEKNEKLIYRGCIIDGGKTDSCALTRATAETANSGIEIVTCDLCRDDACNKAMSTHFDGHLLVVVLLTVLKLTFY